MLAGNAGGDASAQLRATLLARVNQRPLGDPVRDALTRMFAQHQPAVRQRLADPHVLLRAARDTINLLQARSAILAAALGACPECWGTESGCATCGGAGGPGWSAPDPTQFATWILPAINALQRPGVGDPAARDNPILKGANSP